MKGTSFHRWILPLAFLLSAIFMFSALADHVPEWQLAVFAVAGLVVVGVIAIVFGTRRSGGES